MSVSMSPYRFVAAVLCFAALLVSTELALAQFTQQGPKLVGSGGGNSAQGDSVALSADGNTAIVGGPDDNGSIGAAWVFTRSGGVWTQQGPKLVGTGAVGGFQGLSVALSAPPSWAGLSTTWPSGQRGSTPAATESGPSRAANCAQPVPERNQDHSLVLVRPAIALAALDQLLNLFLGEVFPTGFLIASWTAIAC
jgi:hypothetical protein